MAGDAEPGEDIPSGPNSGCRSLSPLFPREQPGLPQSAPSRTPQARIFPRGTLGARDRTSARKRPPVARAASRGRNSRARENSTNSIARHPRIFRPKHLALARFRTPPELIEFRQKSRLSTRLARYAELDIKTPSSTLTRRRGVPAGKGKFRGLYFRALEGCSFLGLKKMRHPLCIRDAAPM